MRVAIVGNGVAGHACAVRLAELGHAPLLIGPGLPHDRPPLTKRALVSGQLPLLADEGALARAGIEHVDGRVVWADPDGRGVRLSTAAGTRTLRRLDGVVLATGLAPAPSSLSQAENPSTAAGFHRLLDRLSATRRVVVVGSGLLGCEAAATLAASHDVTLVAASRTPLARLGAPVARAARRALDACGVDVRTGLRVQHDRDLREVLRSPDEAVVIVATGTRPALPPPFDAGRTVDVDATLRVRQTRRVWACGDVARFRHPHHGALAPPHWDHARASGRHAAEAIDGAAGAYERDPYWFSSLGAVRLQQLGVASEAVRWRDDGDGLAVGLDGGGHAVCVTLVDAPRRLAEARSILHTDPGREHPWTSAS